MKNVFLTDISNMFGIEVFVQGWNETIKLDGTYTKLVDEHTWYGVINTSLIINNTKGEIMITFREWLAEREELEEAINLSDPDKSVSYETFAKAYTDSNARNIGELKIIQKFFKAKEEPFKQEYRGNTYTYIAPLFESKDKKFKIFIETPSSTDSYDTYNVVVADKYMHASFYHKISLNIKEFKKLNNKIIIEGLKELYNKSLAKYENDDNYKKIGKFVFKPNFMNLIK